MHHDCFVVAIAYEITLLQVNDVTCVSGGPNQRLFTITDISNLNC